MRLGLNMIEYTLRIKFKESMVMKSLVGSVLQAYRDTFTTEYNRYDEPG